MQLKVIKNYLIDLDGVILDIKYDTFFWGKHIPRVYSDIHNIDYAEAKTITTQLFNLKRKTFLFNHVNFTLHIDNFI